MLSSLSKIEGFLRLYTRLNPNWIIFPKLLKTHVFGGEAFRWKIKITNQYLLLCNNENRSYEQNDSFNKLFSWHFTELQLFQKGRPKIWRFLFLGAFSFEPPSKGKTYLDNFKFQQNKKLFLSDTPQSVAYTPPGSWTRGYGSNFWCIR